MENNQRQRQTMRDGLFAALALHIFYRNSDIVEFAMETQLSNLLQSLFETDGARFFKTPTFYVMKLLRPHLGQELIEVLPHEADPALDTVATVSADGEEMTVSIVNRHLYDDKCISLALEGYEPVRADIVGAAQVRDYNTFDDPTRICDSTFALDSVSEFTVPAHSVVRICLKKVQP